MGDSVSAAASVRGRARRLALPNEQARIDILGDAEHRKGDPDDVPSAVLSLLLQAPFLTKDGNALEAVYGNSLDMGQTEWLDALRAGGDLGQLSEYLIAAYLFSARAAVGTYQAAAALVRAMPLPLLALLATAGGLAFHRWVPPRDEGQVGRRRSGLRGRVGMCSKPSS